MKLPGPGQYGEVSINKQRQPAYGLGRANRKLLTVEKTMAPSPMSYDIVTGLSMCSSAGKMPLLAQKPSKRSGSIVASNDLNLHKHLMSIGDEAASYVPEDKFVTVLKTSPK